MREPLGLILAGGRGMHMGGAQKADVMLGDTTLLARAYARLEPQVAKIAVNANTALVTKFPTVCDVSPDHLGPLAGVLAGLEWAVAEGASHFVTVAVGTPFFPCDLVPHLLMAGQGHTDGFAIAATKDGLHSTFGLWPVTLRTRLVTFLADGHRQIHAFTQENGAATAHFPETTPPSFFNINTPDDLRAAAKWL